MTRLIALPLTLVLLLPACAAEDPSTAEGTGVGEARATEQAAPVDPSMVAGSSGGGAAADAATLPAPDGDGPSPQLESVLVDVGTAAPRLESSYRGDPYPETLEEALATLEPAGVQLAEGNQVNGYVYDPETVEFTLCVEHVETGAWATYDTRPMSTRDQGESGGCPADMR